MKIFDPKSGPRSIRTKPQPQISILTLPHCYVTPFWVRNAVFVCGSPVTLPQRSGFFDHRLEQLWHFAHRSDWPFPQACHIADPGKGYSNHDQLGQKIVQSLFVTICKAKSRCNWFTMQLVAGTKASQKWAVTKAESGENGPRCPRIRTGYRCILPATKSECACHVTT